MKKIILAAVMLVAINNIASAQNVGIGTNTPNASALLDVTASNKGVLIPRVTNAQMIAIASPANGLLVYNTDSAAFAYRNATAWVFIKGNATASNDWSTKGNAGTDTSKNFIGTTDDVDVIFKRNNEQAGWLNETLKNTSLGAGSLSTATTGFNNTATGYRALKNNSIGYNNTAMGSQALGSNNIGSRNTATGFAALFSNISGNENAANGTQALLNNIGGSSNTASGFQSLFSNGSGFSNVAFGAKALYSNTNRSNLVAIGDSALFNNGTGATQEYESIANTAIGSKALYSNNTGNSNTGVGFESLKSNTTGSYNTAMGSLSMKAGNSLQGNSAFGYRALYNTNGTYNVAMGYDALNGNSGNNNTAIGTGAIAATSAGSNNTALGYWAGLHNTGSSNVFLGYKAGLNEGGSNKLYISNDETDAANTLVYGEFDNKILQLNSLVGVGKIPLTGDNDSRLQVKQKGNQNGIGIEAVNSTNHWDFFVAGAGASNFALYYNGVYKGMFDNVNGAYTAASDRRLKKDITPQVPVLNNVMQLQAYQYHYLDNQSTDRFSNGFMAQDVQKIFPDAVVENEMKDGEKRLGINYQYFTVLAIKGLQEQQKDIEQMKAQMKVMMGEIEKLKNRK
jgi:trimeric autotransporter adhesin